MTLRVCVYARVQSESVISSEKACGVLSDARVCKSSSEKLDRDARLETAGCFANDTAEKRRSLTTEWRRIKISLVVVRCATTIARNRRVVVVARVICRDLVGTKGAMVSRVREISREKAEGKPAAIGAAPPTRARCEVH